MSPVPARARRRRDPLGPPALTFLRIWAEGEVCLVCLAPIRGSGVRIRYRVMTTHAHLVCRSKARELLA